MLSSLTGSIARIARQKRLRPAQNLLLSKFFLAKQKSPSWGFLHIIMKSGYYRLKIIPNQPQTEIRNIMQDGTIKLAVAAAPEKGKANKEIQIFFREHFGEIRILSGLTSREKLVYLESREK